MADLSYTLSIEDQQALRSLKNVQAQVRATSQAFDLLKTAIGALAIGNLIQNAFGMATAMNNISNSTGIALEAVVGFGQAIAANGGTIDRATDGLSDLTKNIGEAARGSSELQNAFGQAGVGLQDLGRLSEGDILRKTIAGLQQIPDAATRTAIAMKLFGESVKGVDLTGLNRDLGTYIQNAGPNADAIRSAAEAQKNFGVAMGNVQVEILRALQPISEFAKSLTTVGKEMRAVIDAFVEGIKYAGSILLAFTALGAVVRIFSAIGAAASVLGGGIANLGRLISILFRGGETRNNLFKNLEEIGGAAGKARVVFQALGGSVDWLKRNFPLLAAAIGGVSAALAKFFGLIGGDSGYTRGKAQLEDYNNRVREAEEAKLRLVQANEKEKQSIAAAVTSMQASNAELKKRIDQETQLMRASEEQRFAAQTLAEAEQNYLKAIEPLQAKILDIRARGKAASETERALLPELQAGIAKITGEYERQLPALQQSINARIQEMQAAKELEIINQSLLKQAENRATVESSVRDIILGGQERINEVYNQAALVSLPGIYGELRKIADEENKIAEAAKRRVAEQFGDDTTGLDQALAEIEAATQVIIQRRQEAVYAVSEQQNSFVSGWQKAFAEYASAASNAATQAQTIFTSVTRGMEDAFMNFAKTGKLSVKDLFKTIVETILRSQVQQLIARTFGALGGSTGGSFLGSLFAGFFADGGRIAPGKVGVVGEAGPEMITGPATVTPMGGGAGLTQVTYNINAVDVDSFRRLVASDPEFMFAVTEQGRRRLPQNRR